MLIILFILWYMVVIFSQNSDTDFIGSIYLNYILYSTIVFPLTLLLISSGVLVFFLKKYFYYEWRKIKVQMLLFVLYEIFVGMINVFIYLRLESHYTKYSYFFLFSKFWDYKMFYKDLVFYTLKILVILLKVYPNLELCS